MTATDGREALQIAGSSWQPDVVLLDPTLPGVNGFSVYEQVQARNQSAVIFVLGDGSAAGRSATLVEGVEAAREAVITGTAAETLHGYVRLSSDLAPATA